ncbi:hypothetical protein ACFQS1_19590 [Paractinoplanes rhizophilus]|uniref:Uncharacterized protein n=1 Tax=Paractinoplanes rhizophilus TaxID=1416877 RepID=A0ABW2HTN7_9ACTN
METASLTYGSVEYYAEIIRENSETVGHTYISTSGLVRAVLAGVVSSEAERLEHIRNVLVAADRVRAEMQASR